MKAVFAATINNADPLAALEVGELPSTASPVLVHRVRQGRDRQPS